MKKRGPQIASNCAAHKAKPPKVFLRATIDAKPPIEIADQVPWETAKDFLHRDLGVPDKYLPTPKKGYATIGKGKVAAGNHKKKALLWRYQVIP